MMNLYSDSIQIDSSVSLGKSRVRSMVNQFNAAVTSSSSSRPVIPSQIATKRTSITNPSTVNTHRQISVEPTTTTAPTNSINKPTITSPSRPSLQRALTLNNQSSVTSPPSTPPTISNNNNNIPSAYKRK